MSIDKNSLVYLDQLDNNVIEMLSEDIGNPQSLKTENTESVVAALNEILGKDIICNAIGSPLLTTDTFAQMGEKIHVMVNDFKAKLLDLGVSVSNIDKIASLIEKMGEIKLGADAEELLAPLEESLRQILEDEGVELSGEETLSELIVKVDEIFNKMETNRQNLITALTNNGKELTGNESFEELIGMVEVTDGMIISLKDIKQVACGVEHTIILKKDGSVWACGGKDYGQLGLGTSGSTTYKTFTNVNTNINNDVKQIACGGYHTVILKNDGSVWSCGDNDNGQLGLGDVATRKTFTKVNIDNVKQIACGGGHTFILKNDGSIWSCGNNSNGQLGLGITGYNTTFTKVTTNINNDVKQISCGKYHTFILKNDGSIYSCGYNNSGQLGLGDTSNKTTFTKVTTNINNDVKQIDCGNSHVFILKNDGSVWGCGDNSNSQLGLNNINNKNNFTQVTTNINNDVKHISCGNSHTFIIKNDGSVWACGSNGNGQIGLGSASTKKTFTQVTTNINNDVKQIACGDTRTFILKNDGSAWACGLNNKGQLGLGNTNQMTSFTRSFKNISITVTLD